MRLLVTRDPDNEAAKVFALLAHPVRKKSLNLAVGCLDSEKVSVVLWVTDLRGLPPDALEPFREHPLCRVFLASSATVDDGEEYARWLRAGASEILLPGMAQEQLKHRMRWAVDGLAEPDPGILVPVFVPGPVYLLTPYRPRHLETMEKWVKPALHYAGYQGVLIRDVDHLSIRKAENHMAQECSFAIAHMGKDDPPEPIHNPRVHAAIRTLVNNDKLVIGIRDSSEAEIKLPGDVLDINCHHFDSEPELTRWLYKILTKARPNAASGATHY